MSEHIIAPMIAAPEAMPANETLHVFPVSTHRGLGGVVFLALIAIVLLVAVGVTIFMGAPPARRQRSSR